MSRKQLKLIRKADTTGVKPILAAEKKRKKPLSAGGWFKSCVHYNSLRLGLENLGENVEPSYVRVHLDSLRAGYG
eukprot:scaffold14004_cov111-Isochrysis_galbana.AAC.3